MIASMEIASEFSTGCGIGGETGKRRQFMTLSW
jgi:hypothetical protein